MYLNVKHVNKNVLIRKALIFNIFSNSFYLVDQKLNETKKILSWSRRSNGPVLCGTVCIMSHLKDINLSFYADAANSLHNVTSQRTSILVFFNADAANSAVTVMAYLQLCRSVPRL